MRINDAIIGAILIIFAIAEIAYTRTFPSLYGQEYGPDLFPILIGAGLILCGAILIFRGLAARGGAPLVQAGEWVRDPRRLVNLALLLGGMIAYILFSDAIGFIPLSLALLLLFMIRLGARAAVALPVALATTLVIHTLFAKLLLVPLPWGILLPIAW